MNNLWMKQTFISFFDSIMEIWGQLLQNISSFLTVDSQADQYSAVYIRDRKRLSHSKLVPQNVPYRLSWAKGILKMVEQSPKRGCYRFPIKETHFACRYGKLHIRKASTHTTSNCAYWTKYNRMNKNFFQRLEYGYTLKQWKFYMSMNLKWLFWRYGPLEFFNIPG
jgi:hypothetical protein